MDLNDGMGQQKVGREFVYQQTTVLGHLGSRPEHIAGSRVRATCELHGLHSATSTRGGSTWFGPHYRSSLIDHILCPVAPS
eukprot:693529-Pyramimonas_sp.AAC.1